MQPGAAPGYHLRYLRQIALPEVGPDGQERLAAATIAVAGERDGDLAAEIAARYLAAGGVGTLRWIGAAGVAAEVLRASNPDLVVGVTAWPGGRADGQADDAAAGGKEWVAALEGVDLVVRSGFDDDPMLRATVRLGIPVVLMRALAERAEVLAVRRQGPCPHVDLAIPHRLSTGVVDGPAAVLAGALGAAEAMTLIVGRAATTGDAASARARHLAVALDGGASRAQDIPWSPECFACGGGATEMVFS
jgi:hypothetical protein